MDLFQLVLFLLNARHFTGCVCSDPGRTFLSTDLAGCAAAEGTASRRGEIDDSKAAASPESLSAGNGDSGKLPP